MYFRKRQKIGLGLMAASVLFGIFIQLHSGSVVNARTVREDKLPSGAVVSEIAVDFHRRYAIPLAAGFVLGLICLTWPSQKPPRIAS